MKFCIFTSTNISLNVFYLLEDDNKKKDSTRGKLNIEEKSEESLEKKLVVYQAFPLFVEGMAGVSMAF